MSPCSTNPSFSLGVSLGGATTLNEIDVCAWKRAGKVWKTRVSRSAGRSTRRRVKSATPLTNGTEVTPPS